jgi:hypothetical protein
MKEIYDFANKLGYSKDQIEIDEIIYWDYDEDPNGKPMDEKDYTVSFGNDYTENWVWTFENNLNGRAVDYQHNIIED